MLTQPKRSRQGKNDAPTPHLNHGMHSTKRVSEDPRRGRRQTAPQNLKEPEYQTNPTHPKTNRSKTAEPSQPCPRMLQRARLCDGCGQAYFLFLWRRSFLCFLYLCFRIFFRRHLITLPIKSSKRLLLRSKPRASRSRDPAPASAGILAEYPVQVKQIVGPLDLARVRGVPQVLEQTSF